MRDEVRAPNAVRESYDNLASEYAARLSHELDGKPMDRALLEEIAARAKGVVCDLGCGPGHVTRFLAEHGASVCGIDLSPRMVDVARRLNPGLRFEVADMRDLAFDDGSMGAVVAMYSLIHFDPEDLARAALEIARVLAPNGILLAAFHKGSEIRHVEELWSIGVRLDFHFFEPDEIVETLGRAGLKTERVLEREPYAGVEVETQRFYVFASRVATEG